MQKTFTTTMFCLAMAATPALAQDSAEIAYVKQILNQLNVLSFKNNREYCGYFGFDANDNIVATPATKGQKDSCLADDPSEDLVLFASYHTHGAFAPDVPAEFPSTSDLEGDESEGVDGYVATPGGRLWYIDGQDMIASQICGIGCLAQDPAFQAGLDGTIAQSYTYEQLKDIEGG
ncbi:MAG: DUF4329 domain-containing protein [Pseudomonadota bacterium]